MADVTVVIGTDNKGAVTGIKQVGDAVEDVEKKSGKASSALGDVAKIAGGFVVAQGLMKLPGLIGGFIGGASDLNESLSKVQTVFGSSAGDIDAWSKTAATGMGMTRGAALEAAGTFGNFLQAMGATTPAAADMSKKMVQLATDLGSFNNADPTEVLLALRSGLSGESEPLRKFGVALSEAAVSAKAVQLGLSATGKELTEQQKIQARYAIIMDQTKTAQGDFARTSDGLANQTKILKAMFSDAANELGTALLPGVVAVAGALIQLLPYALSVGAAIGGPLLEGIKTVAGIVADFALDNLVGPLQSLATMTWDALKDGVAALVTLWGLEWDALKAGINALKDLVSANWGSVKEGAAALKEMAEAKFDQLAPQFDKLKTAAAGLDMKDVREGLRDLKEKAQPALDVLQPLAERVLNALKDGFDDVKEALKPLGPAVADLVEAFRPLTPILEPLGKILGVALVVAAAALLLALEGLVKFIAETLTLTIEAIVLTIKGITLALEFVTNYIGPWIGTLAEKIGEIVETIEGPISTVISFMYSAGEFIVKGLWNGITAWGGWLKDNITGWAGGIIDAAKGAFRIGSPSKEFEYIGQMVVQGFVHGIAMDGPMAIEAVSNWGREITTSFKTGMAEGWGGTVTTDGGGGQGWNWLPGADMYANVPDYVKKLSPAAGGSKSNAGPYVPFNTPWYIGGGQTVMGPGDSSKIPVGAYIPGLGYKTATGWEQTMGAAAAVDAAYKNGTYQSGLLTGMQPQVIQLTVDGHVLATAVTNHLARAM